MSSPYLSRIMISRPWQPIILVIRNAHWFEHKVLHEGVKPLVEKEVKTKNGTTYRLRVLKYGIEFECVEPLDKREYGGTPYYGGYIMAFVPVEGILLPVPIGEELKDFFEKLTPQETKRFVQHLRTFFGDGLGYFISYTTIGKVLSGFRKMSTKRWHEAEIETPLEEELESDPRLYIYVGTNWYATGEPTGWIAYFENGEKKFEISVADPSFLPTVAYLASLGIVENKDLHIMSAVTLASQVVQKVLMSQTPERCWPQPLKTVVETSVGWAYKNMNVGKQLLEQTKIPLTQKQTVQIPTTVIV